MKTIILLSRLSLLLIIIAIYSALIVDVYVSNITESKVSFNMKKIRPKKIGLLLGTSKILPSGKLNAYYTNRIVATWELYRNKKINFVLISGDNSSIEYNEPQMMKEDLMKYGFPENKIFLDYAGFSTYESIYRCWKVFNEKDVIVISQKFHNQRAVFIGNKLGLNVQGYNAKDVNKFFGFKTNVREKFARLKLLFETYFKPKPKYLGRKILIGA